MFLCTIFQERSIVRILNCSFGVHAYKGIPVSSAVWQALKTGGQKQAVTWSAPQMLRGVKHSETAVLKSAALWIFFRSSFDFPKEILYISIFLYISLISALPSPRSWFPQLLHQGVAFLVDLDPSVASSQLSTSCWQFVDHIWVMSRGPHVTSENQHVPLSWPSGRTQPYCTGLGDCFTSRWLQQIYSHHSYS